MPNLPVANTIAWDFTAATSPLTSKIGQTETFALSGGATTSTSDGMVCRAAGARGILNFTNGGNLLSVSYPYTVIAVVRATTGSGSSVYNRIGSVRQSAGTARSWGMYFRPSDGDWGAENGGYAPAIGSALPNSTWNVLIAEKRANGLTLWRNGTQIFNNTAQTLTVPTFATTDYYLVGAREGTSENPTVDMAIFALVPGTLDATDRANLGSSIATARTALGLDAPTSTFSFANTAFSTSAFSVGAFSLESGDTPPPAPAAGGYRLRRAPRGGQ